MAGFVSSLKRMWHRDSAAHPTTHAWVLNLYRAGEHYPETVDDYFPVRHAPWPELADNLARHSEDERKHERMYARAIRRMGEPLRDMGGLDVFNQVIRDCTPVAFRIDDADATSLRRLKLAHFAAHAHFLEKRIATSLVFHADACAEAGRPHVAAVVQGVLADETRHVSYTRAAVDDLVDRRTAASVLDVHRRAEAKANLVFSREQVRRCLASFGAEVPRLHRLVYSFCALIMQEAESHV